MPKPKLMCGAPTQKGSRCRNPGNPNTSGLCALHAKMPAVPDKAIPEPNETLSDKSLNLTTTVAVVVETIVDVAETIAQVIRVVEFVDSRWPQTLHLAHHRVLKPKPNAAVNLIKDCQRMIKTGHQDANLASRFERWYESLPSPVKVEAAIECGDIRAIIRVLRETPTS